MGTESERDDIVQCQYCYKNFNKETFHFDYLSSCPECGAGVCQQVSVFSKQPIDVCIQIAHNQQAKRTAKYILGIADRQTIEEIIDLFKHAIIGT